MSFESTYIYNKCVCFSFHMYIDIIQGYIIGKHVSIYMCRHVPMHFTQYLHIYMEEKQVINENTQYIYICVCACLYYVVLNVNSCCNVSMTFHCCQSRLKCNKYQYLNKLEVDLILWKDCRAIL